MRYGSICSGIEAATAAWHHMGWEPAFFSEIEAFPRAILGHHYPEVPLHGDFTTIGKNEYGKIDLLVGGTPCQSFSVAGLRGGLDDERGNLALEFCRLAQREQPRWIVWENVPGVLSSNGGRDFGSILGALEDIGYGLAYRVLDAQYFGVAQRRRRVFVVGYFGDWRPAAAVLFERHSMSGHPAPSREKGKVAPTIPSRSTGGGGLGTDFDLDGGVIRHDQRGGPTVGFSADVPQYAPETANAITASLANSATGHNKDENVIAFDAYNQAETEGVSKTVAARNDQDTASCVAYSIMPMNSGKDYKARETEVAQPIMASGPVGGNQGGNQGGDFVVQAFAQNTRDEVRLVGGDGENAGALAAQPGMKQTTYIATYGMTTEQTPKYAEDVALTLTKQSPTGGGQPQAVVAFSAKDYGADATEELSPTLRAGGFTNSHQNGGVMPAVVIGSRDVAGALTANYGKQPDSSDSALGPNLAITTTSVMPVVATGFNEDGTARTLTARHDSSPCADRGPDIVAFAIQERAVCENPNAGPDGMGVRADNAAYTLEARTTPQAVAFDLRGREGGSQLEGPHDTANIRAASGGSSRSYVAASAVRRLTPVECERLQGFPDNFTAIPWKKKGPEQCPDGPRYKALGNSMAVPVMRWIGERIQLVDDLLSVL